MRFFSENLLTESQKRRLTKMLQPGKKVLLRYGKGTHVNKTMHIRAVVDENQIIYCYWSRYRQGYVYLIKWVFMFELWIREHRIFDGGYSNFE